MYAAVGTGEVPRRRRPGRSVSSGQVLVLLLGLALAAPLAAQSGASAGSGRSLDAEQSWLALERGRIALEQGDPGAALAAFLEAKETAARDVYPEADLALGDFWLAEGELAQAERAYRRALDGLRIAEYLAAYREYDYGRLGFVLHERIAEVERLRENYGGMEEQYRAIVDADPDFTTGTLADRVTANYLDSGLNKVMTLYRLSSGFAVRAYAELGWLYYRNGLPEKAVRHSLFAVTNILSVVLAELRRADPQYAFVSLETTLRDAYRRPNTRAYLEEIAAWKALYYLAAETYAARNTARARELWSVISRFREAGMYQDLSSRQLARPWVEPPLKEPFRQSR